MTAKAVGRRSVEGAGEIDRQALKRRGALRRRGLTARRLGAAER